MLEIIALVALCRYVNRTLKEVGATAWPFIVLTILMWFGFEFMGALIAAIVTYDPHDPNPGMNLWVYLAALVSAAIGAGLSALIVRWRVASVRRAQRDAELRQPTPLR